MSPRASTLPWLGAVATLAVALRLAWLRDAQGIPFLRIPVLDCQVYHEWAAALARGEPRPEVYFLSPLYAWAIAAVYRVAGPDPLVPRLLQALLAGLTTLLVAATARALAGTAAAILAALLWALLATSIFFDGVLLGAAIATLLAAALGAVLVREPVGGMQPVLAGTLLGLLSLERPNALALAPVVLLATAGGSSPGVRVRRAGIAVLALAATLSPAWLHNLRAGDRVLISANGGINLYLGNHRAAQGVYAGAPGLPDDPAEQFVASRAIAEGALGRSLRPSEVSRFWSRRALAELGEDPRRAARLLIQKVVLLLNAEEAQLNFKLSFVRQRSPVLSLPLIGFGLILPLAGLGAWLGRGSRRTRVVAALAIVYLATILLFFVAARFRMPAMPWLVALAGAGVVELARQWRQGRRTSAAVGLAGAIALAALARLPGLRQSDAAMWNLSGTVAEQEQRPGDAESDYRRALGEQPDFAPAVLNLAALLERGARHQELPGLLGRLAPTPDREARIGRARLLLGQPEEAELALRRALQGEPARAEWWNLLGAARAGRGEREAARQAFVRALDLDPTLAAARANLARLDGQGAGTDPDR